MNFNVKNYKIMKITKKIQLLTSSFFLENSELEEVKEFKDLHYYKSSLIMEPTYRLHSIQG